MRNEIYEFIKNKKLFIFAVVVLVLSSIINAIGLSTNNEYLDGLIKGVIILIVFTMFYLSLKHNIIVNLFYGFCVFVTTALIIIYCVNLLSLI